MRNQQHVFINNLNIIPFIDRWIFFTHNLIKNQLKNHDFDDRNWLNFILYSKYDLEKIINDNLKEEDNNYLNCEELRGILLEDIEEFFFRSDEIKEPILMFSQLIYIYILVELILKEIYPSNDILTKNEIYNEYLEILSYSQL